MGKWFLVVFDWSNFWQFLIIYLSNVNITIGNGTFAAYSFVNIKLIILIFKLFKWTIKLSSIALRVCKHSTVSKINSFLNKKILCLYIKIHLKPHTALNYTIYLTLTMKICNDCVSLFTTYFHRNISSIVLAWSFSLLFFAYKISLFFTLIDSPLLA